MAGPCDHREDRVERAQPTTQGAIPVSRPRKILRVIARLNIGGPALHTILLTERLAAPRYESMLVTGQSEPREGDMSELADLKGVRRIVIPSMGRPIHLWLDLQAWWALFRLIRRERPHLVHTHTAKAGALGRTAALVHNQLLRLGGWVTRQPVESCRIVHTFHGHVLEGYFNRTTSWVFIGIERFLARFTDCVITVSPSIRDDLLRLGIGKPERLRVVPLGLPLETLLALPEPNATPVPLRVGSIGRLVPIKNHELLLQVAKACCDDAELAHLRFEIVGDGELRERLNQMVQTYGFNGYLTLSGWKSDMAQVCRYLDIVCLTSLNEGTPVSLIEALAAGRPVIATDVGGVRDLLGPCQRENGSFRRAAHGLLVRSGDAEGFRAGLRYLAAHPEQRLAMGRAGRRFVQEHYSAERLERDITTLYEELWR